MNIIRNLKKTGPTFLLLISFPAGAQAQEVKWPVTYYVRNSRSIAYTDIRRGYIVTSSADTVKGFIKLRPNRRFYFEVLDTATKKIREVDIPDILLIRAYDDTIDSSFSDYYNLPYQNSMWLLLARKSNISIYRRELESSPSRMILVTPDDKRIKILSGRSQLFRNNDLDAQLFHFIKKRYKTPVNQHFASTQDIYTYILENENRRIK